MKNYLAKVLSRHPTLFTIAVVIYLISPIDVVPEALLGPLGFIDDLLVMVFSIFLREYAKKLKIKDSSRRKDYYDTTAQ